MAKRYPANVALSEANGIQIRYTELSSRATTVAAELSARGIGRGHSVAILQKKSIDNVICILATLHCGATVVPLDPSLPAERVRFLLRDLDPEAFICDHVLYPSELPCDTENAAPLPGLESCGITIFPINERADQARAYILYTSGSTGNPKGVCISHAAAQSFSTWGIKTFSPGEKTQVASIAPFHFDLSIFDIYCTLCTGGTLHLFDHETVRNPRMMSKLLSENKISLMYATPSFYMTLMQFGTMEKYDWSHVGQVLFAGEIFPVKHLHALMKTWSDAKYYNLYGPTETNVCTWYEVRAIDEQRTTPYPIGVPCEGILHEISEEQELLIGGAHVADGYHNREELTQEKFFTRNNMRWFCTGDLVKTDEAGQLVYTGRKDRMIKRRGFRVEPAEVEQALQRHPDIMESAVIPALDSEGMTLLIAYIVLNGQTQADVGSIKIFLASILPEYMLPDRIISREILPKNPNGKTDYTALKQSYVNSFTG
ncbi:MAG TPA: amino acid adenylation domain-containing protein [Bacteroidia bacterium]|nr:amino acid adenylation domain-containing protein [Bacteroidia bacterium]